MLAYPYRLLSQLGMDSETFFPLLGALLALAAVAGFLRLRASRRKERAAAQEQLIQGAKLNDMEMVHKAMARGGLQVVKAKGPVRKQPVHVAAQYNSTDVLHFLLDSGAHPDCTDHAKMTPLHFAAMKGSDAAIKILLKRGASLDARDTAEYTPLLFACLDGHARSCEILIDAGADLDARDKVGQTGLMFAACKNKLDVLSLLLERGADKYLHARENITALDYAHRKKNRACIDLLEGKTVPRPKPKLEKSLLKQPSKVPSKQGPKKTDAGKEKAGFSHKKAMKAPSEGEEGYRPPAPASQSKPAQSKLEALVERHEAASANPAHSVQERSDNLATTLKNKG